MGELLLSFVEVNNLLRRILGMFDTDGEDQP